MISLNSHTGTHIDLPRHFCQNRDSVQDLLKESNIFFPTYCISCNKNSEELITAEELLPEIIKIPDAHALLLRTGFSQERITNPDVYSYAHPYIDPELADILRENCKNLRLFGIDLISVSVPSHREIGHRCHRAFLCDDKPILLLEDAFIPDIRFNGHLPNTLALYPTFLDDLDATPVTAFLLNDQF